MAFDMYNPGLRRWRRFWARFAGPRGNRLAARLAAWGAPPFHGQAFLAYLHPHGYVAASARLAHPHLICGRNVYVGDGVVLFSDGGNGRVELQDRVHVYGNALISTGSSTVISVGTGTHIQPGCHLHAQVSDISIGRDVDIAPRCALYSYTHGTAAGEPTMYQPLVSKGPIVIGDGCWLGHGVVVLSGVRIGAGAVIGANSVVSHDIPENAIAAGAPARVVRYRTAAPPPHSAAPIARPAGLPH